MGAGNCTSVDICLRYYPSVFYHSSFIGDIWIAARILPSTSNVWFTFKKELSTRDINVIIPRVCLIDILHTWMKSFDGLRAVSLSCDPSKSRRRGDLFTYFSILREGYSPNPSFSLSVSNPAGWRSEKACLCCIVGIGGASACCFTAGSIILPIYHSCDLIDSNERWF